jgi:hypothetical protein
LEHKKGSTRCWNERNGKETKQSTANSKPQQTAGDDGMGKHLLVQYLLLQQTGTGTDNGTGTGTSTGSGTGTGTGIGTGTGTGTGTGKGRLAKQKNVEKIVVPARAVREGATDGPFTP